MKQKQVFVLRGMFSLLLLLLIAGCIPQEGLFGKAITLPNNAGIGDATGVLQAADLLGTGIPQLNQPVTDPTFNVRFKRITDATSRSGGYAVHDYSQLQAFSYDNRYILLNGDQGYIVKDVATAQTVRTLADSNDFGVNAPRWRGNTHNIIFFDDNGDSTLRLEQLNVDSGSVTPLFTFPANYQTIVTVSSSDELSNDGRWLAGLATTPSGNVIFSLNIEESITQFQLVGTQVPISDLFQPTGSCEIYTDIDENGQPIVYGAVDPDWIGVSPLGNYLIVQWERDGTTPCSGLELRNIQTGALIANIRDRHDHGSLGLTADGREAFLSIMGESPENSQLPALAYWELGDRSSNPHFLLTIPWNLDHVSCVGPRGICAVTSYYAEGNQRQVFDGEIYLIGFDRSVKRLLHHRSSECGYWVQPRASISRDGRYIVFDSDLQIETGGQTSCERLNTLEGGGEVYIIDLGAAPTLGGGSPPAQCSPDCGPSQRCDTSGTPRCVCITGTTSCNSQCVNINTDNNNCGACGTACASSQTCNNGACQSSGQPPTNAVLGDVTGPNNAPDGILTTQDVLGIIDHILGRRVLAGQALTNANLDNNAAINVLDVIELINRIVGTSSQPVACAARDRTACTPGNSCPGNTPISPTGCTITGQTCQGAPPECQCPAGQTVQNGACQASGGTGTPVRFFISLPSATGGNLGGLTGADAQCQTEAEANNRGWGGVRTWHAYLSATTENARDRIGAGPWHNVNRERIANNVEELHTNGILLERMLTAGGQRVAFNLADHQDVNGQPLRGADHDILTGSTSDGTLMPEVTCNDWTDGGSDLNAAAQVGHSDDQATWNSAHATSRQFFNANSGSYEGPEISSSSCSREGLSNTGSQGRIYCFAIN